MNILRAGLLGAGGFGIGGVIGGAVGDMLFGTLLQGIVGGVFLGLALMPRGIDPMGVVVAALSSALGLFTGTFVAFAVWLGFWEPPWHILGIGLVAGATAGGTLGLGLRVWKGRALSWRAAGLLTLAGAGGFGLGWVVTEGTPGSWPSIWIDYPETAPGAVTNAPEWLFLRMALQGVIGGFFLGSALGGAFRQT